MVRNVAANLKNVFMYLTTNRFGVMWPTAIIRRRQHAIWPHRRPIMRKITNPAGERNKDPILGVLKCVFSKTEPNLRLLEISSGVGLHAAYFAQEFPNITFQPSEFDSTLFDSIDAYRQDVKNVQPPIYIDISKPCTDWQNEANLNHNSCANGFDYMLNINMLHISPIACAHGLFSNASKLLKPGGLLVTYGPYAVDGVLTPDSNVMPEEYVITLIVERYGTTPPEFWFVVKQCTQHAADS
uniref:Methyltransferase type 12 domain-containing protein n=1 Tax=Anopheles epiroticus TaxID=199890 RepID=A0A182PCF9_9DIPT